MWQQTLFRFLIGGVVVSAFAAFGSLFKPKSFAGIFGAAPSVALASLGLAVASSGRPYAAAEARSMVAGGVAFFIYTACTSWVMKRLQWGALAATIVLIPVWLGIAFLLWFSFLR